ncbi:MAG: guanylate kinase, partial [Verrucomicrobiales bacterium]
NYYGTLKSTVMGHLQEGTDVLMDLDVQGAKKIRECRERLIKDASVDIFIMPPSLKELHRRLSGRGTEDEAAVILRLDNAQEEIKHWRDYQYAITSGSPREDRTYFDAILESERRRTSRLHFPGESRK